MIATHESSTYLMRRLGLRVSIARRPQLRRVSSGTRWRIQSIRLRATRLASGSMSPLAARAARSCNSAMTSGGIINGVLTVLMRELRSSQILAATVRADCRLVFYFVLKQFYRDYAFVANVRKLEGRKKIISRKAAKPQRGKNAKGCELPHDGQQWR